MNAPASLPQTRPARPFVKSVGGKTALLPEILPRLPKKIGTYYEPFVGGGAVFFALASEFPRRYDHAVLCDTNIDLINVYRQIKSSAGDLIDCLRELALEHGEDQYYEQRALCPEDLGLVVRAARYIYLNKTCFNGLTRYNKAGKFNVPFGRYANPTICDEENIRACQRALGDVIVSVGSFEQTMHWSERGDASYIDPPYLPLSATSSFTAYTADGFGLAEQQALAKQFGKTKGFVLLSNSDTPITRELYRRWQVETVHARRSVNSVATGRGKVSELLVTRRRRKT